MLEEEGSDNIEEITSMVGSEALMGQKTSVNQIRLGEEVLKNVKTEAEGIVEPRRSFGAFMAEVKKRFDTVGLTRDDPEWILEEEEDEIETVPVVAMTGEKKFQKRAWETKRI